MSLLFTCGILQELFSAPGVERNNVMHMIKIIL